ncbi:MAG: hypothetical protein J2P15_03320, partial [Micromonosporaceae bacterium]|nr:hypothetical protein [Micromonosporaceae bacterium]
MRPRCHPRRGPDPPACHRYRRPAGDNRGGWCVPNRLGYARSIAILTRAYPAWARRATSSAGRRADIAAAALFLLLAVWVTGHLWRDPTHRVARVNPGDNTLFDWMLAHGARVVAQGQSPFFSQAMNAPTGVNLIANTSVPGLSIPLAPVTLLFGPGVSFVVLLTLALSLTAFGWYY